MSNFFHDPQTPRTNALIEQHWHYLHYSTDFVALCRDLERTAKGAAEEYGHERRTWAFERLCLAGLAGLFFMAWAYTLIA